MSKKKKTPSLTDIRNVLSESVFNPRLEGHPMALVMQDSDPNYLESRAMEFIREAKQCLGTTPDNPTNIQLQQYNGRISKAISLIAMAKVIRNHSEKPGNNKVE